jgi:hypothetical protein
VVFEGSTGGAGSLARLSASGASVEVAADPVGVNVATAPAVSAATASRTFLDRDNVSRVTVLESSEFARGARIVQRGFSSQ